MSFLPFKSGCKAVTVLSGIILAAVTVPAKAATFTVSNTNNSGPGSLRLAINSANEVPGSTINFNLPSGVQVISPRGVFPAITAAGTTIDGFSQPGASKRDNNFSQRPVIIDGSQLVNPGDLLTVSASDVTITGLTLTKSPRTAVHVTSGNASVVNNLIVGNAGAGIRADQYNGATVFASNGSEDNAGLGVDYRVAGDKIGVTPNDSGDTDGIPNQATVRGAALRYTSAGDPYVAVNGNFTGAPNTLYKVEVVGGPDLNPSTFGEGLYTLGDTGFLRTDSAGRFTWSANCLFAGGGYISALVTQDLGSGRLATGEYSKSIGFLLGSALKISGMPESLREGGPSATVTLSRPTADSSALQIQPASSPEGQLQLPLLLTIPAGQKSVSFTLSAVDDTDADGDVPVGVGFFASGYTPVGALVRVRDNEPQTLSLSFSSSLIREGGTQVTGTLRRNKNFGSDLPVTLAPSVSGRLNLPSSVTIPVNTDEVTFPVTAVADNVQQGPVVVLVTPSASGYTVVPASLEVQDSSPVNLSLSLPSAVTEGDSSLITGTVSRDGATTFDLVVSLTSSPSGQLTLPASVIIPAGSASANFTFRVIDDTVVEASPTNVLVTAFRAGTNSGTATVGVVDNDEISRDLLAWGYGQYGQVGNGGSEDQFQPVTIPLSSVVSLAANGSHSLAVLSSGRVAAWGYNGAGQLGDGTTTDRATPIIVPGLFNVKAVAAGWYHSLAVTSDGLVYAWGFNQNGQIGDGTRTRRLVPVQVVGLSNVAEVSAGVYFSMARTNDNRVFVWGNNQYGQFGNGTSGNESATPIEVTGLGNITAISAGAGHSLFLRANGRVIAAGWNAYGQLGTEGSDRSTPVVVSSVTGATAISAGYAHSVALTASGNAQAWGNNDYGQLGTDIGRFGLSAESPGTVNLTGIAQVAAGSNFTAFRTTAGEIYTTGDNDHGQLGFFTEGSSVSYPLQVPTITDAKTLASGYGHVLSLGVLRVLDAKKRLPSAHKF